MVPPSTGPGHCPRGLAPWQLELAVGELLREPGADLSVADIANRCGLSRSYFERAFKISMGTPPHRWMVQQRVRRAAELLEWTDEKVCLIASYCGFADQSHLTRVFGATMGCSPAAWRRRRRAGWALAVAGPTGRTRPDPHRKATLTIDPASAREADL
ncbi:helix-turn-helix domain-containing protein [Brevundimonas lenta]|uniref:Transcriptional regulator GlxA family with amidase domain n=1 Tax=Brevundimonas lenta TaxID=424796 RepID=A0A7W6JA91_9CAUL|nr:AraC family transcriptional regulator [Brevundimonas lenta]MBB4081367.1 transcriptional regulator GlxA family with amidase domain [Brevundimonas lenta]